MIERLPLLMRADKDPMQAHRGFDALGPEVEAAYAQVEAMWESADAKDGVAPLWYGWALREAFLAGVLWERGRKDGG